MELTGNPFIDRNRRYRAQEAKPRSITLILAREDIRNPLHPFMWEEICDDLGLDRDATDSIELTIAKASAV